MWQGAKALLLTEFLENKEKLNELKCLQNYLVNKCDSDEEMEELEEHYEQEIRRIEHEIVGFICSLDSQHLKSIIYMSLDMNVKVGHPDKLMN